MNEVLPGFNHNGCADYNNNQPEDGQEETNFNPDEDLVAFPDDLPDDNSLVSANEIIGP